MSSKAQEIAEEHFRRMNPSMWDGTGDPPATFRNHRITYSINRYTELDVSFEQTTDGWQHCCKLRDTLTGKLLATRCGVGIDSPQSLVDTILAICKEMEGIHLEYAQLKQIFRELKRTSPMEDLTAHIVFTEDSFTKQYPLLSRTYRISSDNKAFWSSMGGYSIFACCLDVTSDQGVRLDWYMEEERNPGGWKVEDCYILERMRDAETIPDLIQIELEDETMCYCFGTTCIRAYETRANGKIRLEPLAGNQTVDDKCEDLSIDRVYGYCTLLERYLNQEAGQ